MRSLFGALAFCGAGVMFVGPATAQVIYDSGGFEPPRFIVGPLDGQDPFPVGPWVKAGSNALSDATVQATPLIPVASGIQAVQLTRAPASNGDVRYGVQKLVSDVPDRIYVDWDMRVPQATGSQPFGPYFAVEAYDAHDNVGPSIRLMGSAGIDGKTGEILYQLSGSGVLAVAGTAAFDTWHHFQLRLDYVTDSYDVYFGAGGGPLVALVLAEPFVDGGFPGGIDDFTDAPIAALAAGGDSASLAAGGTAYYDNYVITYIPEPTSLAALALGGLLLVRRRRAH